MKRLNIVVAGALLLCAQTARPEEALLVADVVPFIYSEDNKLMNRPENLGGSNI